MEEQKLTAEVECEDQEEGCHWQKEGRRVREMREERNERKREEEFRDKKSKQRKYSEKGASRKMSLVSLENALLPSWFPLTSLPNIHTDLNKADLFDKTAP